MTATEYVILVDENDREIGTAEKLSAHEKNLLHRAFSIFIFRREPRLELLLQQRALTKYHSPGLWTNTCCSHPRPGESILAAAERRLQEEFGIQSTLKIVGRFHYNAHFPNGLSENELDHVLIGEVDTHIKVHAHPDEIHAYRWVSIPELEEELTTKPTQFTPWLKQALEFVK
jgi:isopentenyl-diphosphate delta-isomerase type 1